MLQRPVRTLRPFLRCGVRCASSSDAGPAGESTTHFGYQEVPREEKKGMVKGVFHKVADSYDLMNDVMSAGVHRVWKDEFLRMLSPPVGSRLLDVAGGTGDISFRFLEHIRANLLPKTGARAAPYVPRSQRTSDTPSTSPVSGVVVCDINSSMLDVGRDRAVQRGYGPLAEFDENTREFVVPDAANERGWWAGFKEGDAESLPFNDNSFDAYTISFGLRNVTDVPAALREAHRVLKPGGRFMCLEFSKVDTSLPLVEPLYNFYSFSVIPELGHRISGDRDSYQYLVESIRRFPSQPQLVEMMGEAGFAHSTYTNLTFGVVAVHSGFKPVA